MEIKYLLGYLPRLLALAMLILLAQTARAHLFLHCREIT